MYKWIAIPLLFAFTNGLGQRQPCPAGTTHEFIRESVLKDSTTYIIDTLAIKLVKDGKGYVFRYRQSFDCPEYFDDETSETIKWCIPDTVSQFTLLYSSADQFPQNIIYSTVGGALRTRLHNGPVTGSIKGTKTNDVWAISATLQIEVQGKGNQVSHTRDISFTANFIEWDYGVKLSRRNRKLPKQYF